VCIALCESVADTLHKINVHKHNTHTTHTREGCGISLTLRKVYAKRDMEGCREAEIHTHTPHTHTNQKGDAGTQKKAYIERERKRETEIRIHKLHTHT